MQCCQISDSELFPQWNDIRGFSAHPLDEYLEEMEKEGVFGDEITLRCIANSFNVEIKIAI